VSSCSPWFPLCCGSQRIKPKLHTHDGEDFFSKSFLRENTTHVFVVRRKTSGPQEHVAQHGASLSFWLRATEFLEKIIEGRLQEITTAKRQLT
jgi:hypothetical protein